MPELVRTLKGVLPCARCGYELKGLSIRGSCPECGLAVRATLLAAVDPAADELRPLVHPRVVVCGLVTWCAGGLVGGVGVLSLRILDLTGWASSELAHRVGLVGLIGVGASWIGSTVLIRPVPGTPMRDSVRAVIALVAYAGVVAGYAYLHLHFDLVRLEPPYLDPGVVTPTRSAVRLLMGALLLVIIVFLRPNARMLAARSLVVRTGRVDRQPMYAMAAAVGVAMLGDVAHLATPALSGIAADVLWTAGSLLIAVGSMLLLAGLAGMVVDAVRVSRVLLEPSPSMRDVLEGRAGDAR